VGAFGARSCANDAAATASSARAKRRRIINSAHEPALSSVAQHIRRHARGRRIRQSWRRDRHPMEQSSRCRKLKRNRGLCVNGCVINNGPAQGAEIVMRQVTTAADRIDYWIRHRVVPCAPRSNVNPALDRSTALAAIGRSLRDQYDALSTPLPPRLAALVKQLKAQ
jgi:hypothetical protein